MARAHLKTVTLAILVASVVLPTLVRAVDYNAGVKAGDWIKYGQVTITWSGNGTEPSYITEEKKMDWAKMEVESVTGTIVSLNTTIHFNNGTETFQSSDVDLNGSVYMGSRFLIAANLESGDPLSTEPDSLTINQTTTGIYAGASRNVNLLNVTAINENQTATITVYYDQSTGFMVEMYMKSPDFTDMSTPTGYVEVSLKATETNMWSTDLLGTLSDNIIYIIAGTVLVIIVIAAALVLRKKKPPPPSPQQTTKTSATDTKQE